MASYKPSDEAMAAATWVVEMEPGTLRDALWNGHRIRRIERNEGGINVTDHTAADAWLVEQWRTHTSE